FSSTYDTHVYFDYTSTSAASLGVTGFPLMDGDVLFFAGHGDGLLSYAFMDLCLEPQHQPLL
ncbi:MAG: hypothetical protein PHY11_04475, partial [Bacilli bacterium]|nr:hypothetical protein [Bacilli bacterium]